MTGRPPSAALTDVGRRREHNEDAIIAEHPLYAVADGVGGAMAGECASRLAIEAVAALAVDIVDASSRQEAEQRMAVAIEAANDSIRKQQVADPARSGMATTMTAMVDLGDGGIVIGHVGDSRAYLVDPHAGQVRQLTDDHSIVGELLRAGHISPEEAAVHPNRNVITRALGSESAVAVDTQVVDVHPGQWIVLCSDGLTGLVGDDEILAMIQAESSADVVASTLVAQANERGGHDNISVVLVQPAGAATARPAVELPGPAEISGELDVIAIDRAHTVSTGMDELAPDIIEAAAGTGGPAGLAARHEAPPAPPPPPSREELRSMQRAALRRWLLIRSVAALGIVAAAFGIGMLAWSHSYFITVRDDGRIGIDRGFPISGMSRQYRTIDVARQDLSSASQARYLDDHTLRGRVDAERLLKRMPDLAGRCDRVATSDPTERQLPDPSCPESP